MSNVDFDALFKELRDQADKDLWSKAAVAVRAPIVAATEEMDRFLVTDPQTKFSYTVELFPADVDWTCDCSSHLNPCLHVLCAAIAKRQNAIGARTLATKGSLRYTFYAAESRLAIKRELVRATGEVEPFKLSLTNEQSRHVASTLCTPTEADVRFELTLRQLPDGSLNPQANLGLLEPLCDIGATYFEDKAITISKVPFGWTLEIVKEGPFYKVRLYPTQATRRFSNGWALVDNELRLLAKLPPSISSAEVAALQQGKAISEREFREFCALRLNLYREVCEIVDHTSIQVVNHLPRAELICEQRQQHLHCYGRIVYGDIAAIESGILVSLSDQIPNRSIERELLAIRQFEAHFGFAIDQKQMVSDEAAIHLAGKIAKWTGDVKGDAWQNFEIKGSLEPFWQGDKLLFRVVGSTTKLSQFDSTPADEYFAFETVAKQWQAGHSLLSNNGLLKIPGDWFAERQSWVLDYLAHASDEIESNAKVIIKSQLQAEYHGRLTVTVDALQKILEAKHSFAAEPKVKIEAQLRPYQRAAVAWLSALRKAGMGGILADDMGLGKTLQTIVAAEGPVLVVAPTTLLRNWQKEWLRFRPDIKCHIYHGGNRQWQSGEVCITSYGILRNEVATFTKLAWQTLILDEAHQVKNSESLIFNALLQISAKSRFALTGTPIENDLIDIWGIMRLVNPGLLPGDKQTFREVFSSEQGRRRLKMRMEPFLLRRTKAEVLSDLPEKFENIVPVTLGEQEFRAYKDLALQAKAEIENGAFMQTLAWITRLRQFACDPNLVSNFNLGSAKIELLLEMLNTAVAGGHRALVFSQWTSLLDRIEIQLSKNDLAFLRIDGSTSSTKRAEVVDTFQDASDQSPRILLMSLKAGGVGLNLTAADHVFIMDPWWNPAAEAQAADRAHRIGQNRAVNIYKIVAEGTIEEKIIELQLRKKDLARDILDRDGDSSFNQLSIAELKDLLN